MPIERPLPLHHNSPDIKTDTGIPRQSDARICFIQVLLHDQWRSKSTEKTSPKRNYSISLGITLNFDSSTGCFPGPVRPLLLDQYAFAHIIDCLHIRYFPGNGNEIKIAALIILVKDFIFYERLG